LGTLLTELVEETLILYIHIFVNMGGCVRSVTCLGIRKLGGLNKTSGVVLIRVELKTTSGFPGSLYLNCCMGCSICYLASLSYAVLPGHLIFEDQN
jgi:hypothetical protein